jgi:hypothetical protein
MPKSRRGKQRGKKKGRKSFSAPAVQAPVAAEAVSPPPTAERPAPPAPKPKAPAAAVTPTTNVAAELRRIGIIAGSMVVILVILALILT